MTLKVVDLSGHQAGIDLSKLGAEATYIKATGSTSFLSAACDAQYQQAKRLGLGRGVYHFLRDSSGPAGTSEQSADWFLSQTKGYHGDAIPILDWESVIVNDPLLADVGYAKRWLDRVKAGFGGSSPLIYMSQSTLWLADWSPVAKDYGVIIAQYATMNPQDWGPQSAPPAVKYWAGMAMWQYTSTGHLPGWAGNLDLNEFYGDRAAWDKYAHASGTAPAPAKPAPAVVKPAPKPAAKPAAPKPATGTFVVTVDPGDTLSGIAAQWGTSVAAIRAVNTIPDPNLIHAGQRLNIPRKGGAPAPKPAAGPAACRVDTGDTLSSIGTQWGIPWQTIASLNGIKPPYTIYPNQQLRLR